MASTKTDHWRLKLGPGGSHSWVYLADEDSRWQPDGHFAGEYGGPMFLLPGVVIGSYITGAPFTTEQRLEMIRYLLNTAHPSGCHVGGVTTCLGTVLNYASLRLLGVDAEHPAAVKARTTLLKLGGTAAAPSWGKLLPSWLPFHPGRWWIHTRVVFLPMSYLYRVRFQAAETPLTLALRKEMYKTPYDSIDWPAQCNNIAEGDIYAPHSRLMDSMNLFMKGTIEACPFPPLQRRAVDHVYELICMEDENTNFQDLAPVSKMMNMICRMHRDGRDSEAVARHAAARADVMWLTRDGMLVTGTNGSQLWDTAFVAQALIETGLVDTDENKASALKMLEWIDEAQIRENPKHHHTAYRQASKGAWAFSTKEQGYTLTDCTSEALKAVLFLQNRWHDSPKLISDARIFDAVNLLLSMQCSDGGFGAYELTRAPKFLESLNSAEVFGDTMTEHTSVITALRIFQQYYADYRKKDIDRTVARAIKYLHGQQRADGSWYGTWGICFTYATMFALESLGLAGETYANSKRVKRACEFLLSKQMSDGGWGESWKSCEEETYVQHEESQVVQTSWAAMALMYARYPDTTPIKRAVTLVRSRQLPDGQWPQEAVEGIFNKTCTIVYPNSKLIFTVWMLGLAHKYIEGKEG
ncbi:terpene synthase [Mycena alexandri]|uniref:Terpene cyclase/mutase family member n=1 Tax=Mycena alexandri TaxID=1745969 RepID=A0AAD6TFW0_9AGAR|nr:terpene synthase [Mycena alexandri]